MVRLRTAMVDDEATVKPAEAVVRQVRRLYREACRYIDNRAFFRGYRVRPLA